MKVIKDLSIEILGTNTHYFKLDEFNDNSDTDILLYGYNILENRNIKNKILNYKRKVYFNVTMPTEFCGAVPTIQDDFFNEVYTICPYSVKWLNEITKSNRYKFIWYPFNYNDIPSNLEKIFDVCYHGGLHGNYHLECLNIMRKFNYRYMTMTHDINQLTQDHLRFATNFDLTNQEKINLISKCKISICYNYFSVRNSDEIFNIKNRKEWNKNEAFKHIDDLRIIPQFKSRVNEAAMAKSLILIQKDPWNVIECWYTPDVDFIYFDSNDVLEIKIREILNNYDQYQTLIENAYNKSLNYTTKKLYEYIQNRL